MKAAAPKVMLTSECSLFLVHGSDMKAPFPNLLTNFGTDMETCRFSQHNWLQETQDTADTDIDFVRSKVDAPGHNSFTHYEIKSLFFVHPSPETDR